MTTVGLVFALLVAYQIKHFLADYPLQVSFMLGKFRDGWEFLPPLLAHVLMHGGGTLLIASVAGVWQPGVLLQVFLLDVVAHFFMDRIKAGKRYLGRFKSVTAQEYSNCMVKIDAPPFLFDDSEVVAARAKLRSNMLFWWSLGLDQMVHHLTHYGCIYIILRSLGRLP